MSAFICSDLHIATIASFAAGRLEENGKYIALFIVQELANRLKRCNIESVNFRYSEKTPARKCKKLSELTLSPITEPAKVYGLIRCWNYQSCEDSQSIDFHALSALLDGLFTPEEKEAAKGLNIWAI